MMGYCSVKGAIMTVGMSRIREFTEDFFDRHWPADAADPPTWSEPWYFRGTIPNHDHPGCYALLAAENVVYMGVGASNPGGRHEGHGLGSRLASRWRKKRGGGKEEYEPAGTWRDLQVSEIRTIGFPRKYGYMAAALELFLLQRIPTKENRQRPGALS